MVRNRATRRKKDYSKAVRKSKIAKRLYFPMSDENWYDNLHQFSKNKIHCSCPICRSKTNNKKYRNYGGVKNYKFSELRNITALEMQLNDYYEGKE